MNILILTSWYPNSECEYEGVFVKDQAQCLATKHNVTVVIYRVNNNSKISFFKSNTKEFTERNVKTIEIIINRSIPIYNQFNFLYTAIKQLKIISKTRDFDLIHAHVSYPAGVIAQFISRYLKIPYFITEHSSPFESLFRSKLHKYLSLNAINNSNRLISVSQPAMDTMQKYLRKGLNRTVVSNVVEVSRFKDAEPMFLNNDKFTFGFLGNLNSDQKGLDFLINAFSKLSMSENARLLIAGEGKLRKDYESLVLDLGFQKVITFIGSLNPLQVPSFMKSLDCFVLPSRHETFGVVVIEALAAGVPVISSRCGGPESFINSSCGILVDVANIPQLTSAMEIMLENRHNYNSNEMSKFADNQFGRDSFISQIENAFQI